MGHLSDRIPSAPPKIRDGGERRSDDPSVPGRTLFPGAGGTDRNGGKAMNLSVIDYIGRINRLYRLIRMEHTGSLKELAGIMRVSERTVSNYLEELRLMGADIRFSRLRNTYYFDNRFILYATFEARIETEILEEEKHDSCSNNK